MVREAHRVHRARRIDRLAARYLDDHDALEPYRATARFGQADRFTADLTDLAPRRHRLAGEHAESVDAAARDADGELLVRGMSSERHRPMLPHFAACFPRRSVASLGPRPSIP